MRFVCDSCRAQYMISDEKVGAKGVKVRCKKCGYVILVRRAEATPPPETDGEATQVMQLPFGLAGALGEDPEVTAPGAPAASSGPSPSVFPSEELGGKKEGNGLFSGVEEDEIGAVFDSVLNSGAHKLPSDDASSLSGGDPEGEGLGESPDDRMSTRVLDGETMRKLAAESGISVAGVTVSAPEAQEAKAKSAASYEWYVALDEKQEGPLSLDKVKALWESGEVGPDSLAWRAGMADWIPVSEISELASALAPRPAKPVIMAPEPSKAEQRVVGTMPVESAFSAGGVTRTSRSEVPVMAASAGGEKSPGGWKPSAASALASLVQEEIQVLSKPAAKPVEPTPAPVSALPGLLDLPQTAAEPLRDPTPSGPITAPLPMAPAPAPVQSVPAASPYGGSPYGAPASYTPYAREKSKTGLYIGLGAGALLVLVLAIFGAAAMMNDDGRPVAVVPPPAAPVAVAAVTPPPAPAAAAPVAPAAPVAAAPAEPVKAEEPKAAPPPEPAKVEAPEPVAVAKAAPVKRTVTRTTSRRSDESDEDGDTITASNNKSSGGSSGSSADEFDSIFGGGSTTPAKSSGSGSKKSSSVYIPPAPGSADVPDSLGQSDIMQVVLANRAALGKCSADYKKEVGGAAGKIAMRWTILTSGKTSAVTCTTNELKSSSLASCLAGEIRKMQFPKHKRQGAPINFPFTY